MRMLASVVALALVAVLGSGCGDDPEQTVAIVSPVTGEAVSVPFEVTVEASVPLGSPADGLHHVHIWFSNELESYLVVEGTVAQINYAPDGEHQMHVSLRNPDHSSAGVETTVPLRISGGTGPGRD